jgi:hypothetical protein
MPVFGVMIVMDLLAAVLAFFALKPARRRFLRARR